MTRASRLIQWTVAPVAGLLLLGAASAHTPTLALVNESPSLPAGLYVRLPSALPERGAVVAVHQPDIVRPYLARRGMPSSVRLIKRVAATGGDLVCSDGRWLIVPFRTEPVRSEGRAGERLPVWRGCRRLAPDERLLLGDTPTSLDSRYFGPVKLGEIDGVYREALTW